MEQNINGFFLINKPKNISSFAVIRKLRCTLGKKKMGHAGTLDPFATGLLPIAIGEATKIIPYISNMKKNYEFKVKWGVQTTTGDPEGNITHTSSTIPKANDIKKACEKFKGEIKQKPPKFSAIKINGERAYKLSRQGIDFEIPEKTVSIYQFNYLSSEKDTSSFEVQCSTGTYIRSLVEDIAQYLGTFAHAITLKRTKIGFFSLSDTILLEKVEKLGHKWSISQILRIKDVLKTMPFQTFLSEELVHLREGKTLTFSKDYEGELLCLTKDKIEYGIAFVKERKIKGKRFFNILIGT